MFANPDLLNVDPTVIEILEAKERLEAQQQQEAQQVEEAA